MSSFHSKNREKNLRTKINPNWGSLKKKIDNTYENSLLSFSITLCSSGTISSFKRWRTCFCLVKSTVWLFNVFNMLICIKRKLPYQEREDITTEDLVSVLKSYVSPDKDKEVPEVMVLFLENMVNIFFLASLTSKNVVKNWWSYNSYTI